MNKEEILHTYLLANIPECISQEEFDDVKGAIKELLSENKELNNKIDKAIKIMEDYTLFDLKADKVMKVIKILKESEVNE